MILPGTVVVFGIFLMRQYIQTPPSELEEAARMDGAGEFRVFWEIILPLCKPAVAALAIFTFVRFWNDFLWPLIALNKAQNYTLTVGVANLQGEFMTDWGCDILRGGAGCIAHDCVLSGFSKILPRRRADGAIKG